MGLSFKLVPSKSKDKDKSNLNTIYVRIAMKGKTADISTHETCLLANWQKTKVKGANAQSINTNINKIKSTIQEIYEHLKKEAPQLLTAALVAKVMIEKVDLNELLNPAPVKERSIVSILSELISKKTFSGAFKEKNENAMKFRAKNIGDYFESIGKKDLCYEDYDVSIAEKMIEHFKTANFTNQKQPKINKNTYVNKYGSLVKEGHSYALRYKLTKSAYYGNKPLKDDAEDTPYLRWNELKTLMEYDFSEDLELDKVRDVFVMMCYTGFLWCDLEQLTKKHLQIEQDGTEWLIKPRQKTKNLQVVPFFDEAKGILEKYNWELPMGCEPVHNSKIKTVAKIVKINDTIQNRSGRKTAGMVWLNDGYPIEEVAKMLGHKDIRVTQKHYAEILNDTLKATTMRIKEQKRNLKK